MTSQEMSSANRDYGQPPERELYISSDTSALRAHAFEDIELVASNLPESVLYLSRRADDFDWVREQWQTVGAPTRLRTATFDEIVDEAHERTTYCGESTHISEAERFRLVEATLERLGSTHPFSVDSSPGPGIRDQVENLLSLFSFAGMHGATETRTELNRLAASDSMLAKRIDAFAELVETFETVRGEWTDEHGHKDATFRSNRYDHVLRTDALDRTFGHVDAVVLGPFRALSLVERQLIEQLTAVRPAIALLPRVDTGKPTGVDRGVERVRSFYREAGFEERHVDAGVQTTDRAEVAATLFQAGDRDTPDLSSIEYRVYESPSTEIRGVARDVREVLAGNLDPDDVGVFVPDMVSTLPQLREVFETYEIPVAWENEVSLGETWTGRLITAICTVAREEAATADLLDIVTNPLVMPEQLAPGFDPGIAVRRAEAVESLRPQVLISSLRRTSEDTQETPTDRRAASQAAAGLQAALDTVEILQGPVESVDTAVEAVLDALGVDPADPLPSGGAVEISRERRACTRLQETAETLTGAASLFESSTRETAADRLQRALTGVTVTVRTGRDDHCVTVADLKTAQYRQFEQTYVIGLNEEEMPTNPDRLAYVRPVNEAAEHLAATDVTLGTRYALGLLLASDAGLVLTRARETNDGEATVPATFLAELERIAGLTVDLHREHDESPGSVEDVLREVATAADVSGDASVVADAIGSFEDDVPDRLETHLIAGAEVAAARATPSVAGARGAYYGRVDTDVAMTLLDDDHAFSPSSLDRYATCGHKYLLRDVLGVREDDEEPLDPNALTRGNYVHNVLEAFYRECRESGLDLPTTDAPEYRDLLASILTDELSTLSNHDTPFGAGWLKRAVAGLDLDESFPVDPPSYDGLFVRFLQSEEGYGAEHDAVPELFEVAIGVRYGGDKLSEEPVEVGSKAVRVRGKVDRMDVVQTEQGTGMVVHDYKTGDTSKYTGPKVHGGIFFQLPTYLLLLSTVTDHEPLAAGYYEVAADSDVRRLSRSIGDAEADETPEDLDQLLARTEERINEIATGVEAGAFQPTFVDKGDAGCKHCEFRGVCDVRHHHKTAVRESAISSEGPYVPDSVREDDNE